MPQNPQTKEHDLSEHEEEAVPFDEVMQKLVKAKPTPKPAPKSTKAP